jgi:hypothetical protein
MSQTGEPQFDRVEFENTAASQQCAACNRPLAGFYFEANGATVCEACRYELEARLTGGSGITRAMRAAGAGFFVAILGALLYYAIAAISGYEFGLIAIVVGYGVGAAVRWGSNGRGGWKYQTLAMALTYFAIVSTYIPPILQAIREAPAEQTAPADTAQTESDASAPAEATAAQPVSLSGEVEASQPAGRMGLARGLFALMLLLAIASVAPFLAGIQNIIGLVIIGIGLYEAWKLNKRAELTITGPHTIANVAAV